MSAEWNMNLDPNRPEAVTWSRGTREFQPRDGQWEMIHRQVSLPYDPTTGMAAIWLTQGLGTAGDLLTSRRSARSSKRRAPRCSKVISTASVTDTAGTSSCSMCHPLKRVCEDSTPTGQSGPISSTGCAPAPDSSSSS